MARGLPSLVRESFFASAADMVAIKEFAERLGWPEGAVTEVHVVVEHGRLKVTVVRLDGAERNQS